MGFDKEKEIMNFAGWFLHSLAQRWLKECGKNVSIIHFSVFKKFLACRVKRELQYYGSYHDLASALVEAGRQISENDINELMEESFDLDTCLKRDIKFLPIWIYFDYDRILPLRRKRAEKQISYFMRLLSTNGAADYHNLVRRAFSKKEFLELHNELVELYADETFIINSSVKSFFEVNSEVTAQKMRRSVLDIGIGLSRETAELIFGEEA